MRRRPNGHVEHLNGSRWRLWMELTPDPLTRKRRRATKVIRATSRREALDELTTFLATRVTVETAPPKRTVDELCDAWLEHLAVADGTKSEWRDSLRRYVRPRIGTRLVVDVDVELLERLWRQLQRDGGVDERALDVATVRKARSALRLAFAQALRWHWIAHNPVAESKVTSSQRKGKVNAPDPDDVALVVAVVDALDADLGTWLRLTAHLGARKEEALGLRWSSIDLDAGTVSIRTVVTKAGSRLVILDHPKNASSVRTVAIAAAHVLALRAMRARHKARALAAGAPWTEDRFVMSPDELGGRPYYPTSISRRLRVLEQRYTRAAGLLGAFGLPCRELTQVTIRQLRHHMATQAISRGHDVRTVAGRGGWANPDTLLRIYADWVPARDRDLADDLDTDVG